MNRLTVGANRGILHFIIDRSGKRLHFDADLPRDLPAFEFLDCGRRQRLRRGSGGGSCLESARLENPEVVLTSGHDPVPQLLRGLENDCLLLVAVDDGQLATGRHRDFAPIRLTHDGKSTLQM